MLLLLLATTGSGTNTALTPAALAHAHALASPALATLQLLTPAALAHAHALASPAISASGSTTLTPAALAHAHALASPALSILRLLTAAEVWDHEISPGVTARQLLLALRPALEVINAGVKKASLLVPHNGNLP